MTATTLVRVTLPSAGLATYLAVAAPDVLTLLAEGPAVFAGIVSEAGLDPSGGCDFDTVPWDVLPGVRWLADAEASTSTAPAVLFIGTVTDGEWTSWYPPCPCPPPPREHP